MKLTIHDRIKFSINAIKKHSGFILIGLAFLSIGTILIYFGLVYNDATALIFFGGFFVLFTLFFLGFTLPSSLAYYYEKSIIKKYGSYSSAIVINKYIENHSYAEGSENRNDKIIEFHYIIDYEFNYLKTYKNSFYVEHKECFDKIEIDSKIPIKFLKHKPVQAEPRRKKICNDLGLKANMCD